MKFTTTRAWRPVQLPWANGYDLPVWIAAYGPKVLAAAGTKAEGLILQLADPTLIKWLSDHAIGAGKDAGRDMSNFKRDVGCARLGRRHAPKPAKSTRWFPAMVGNHVADLVERYGKTGTAVPQRLTDYVEGRKGYDYHHHADKDADHLGFITDDIIDSFGILGTVEQHVEKLKELEVDWRDPVQHLPDVRRGGAHRRGVRQACPAAVSQIKS